LGGQPCFTPSAPSALTASATAPPAQLVNGLFTFNGTAGDLTLPTVADLELAFSSMSEKVDSAFDFFVINIDAGTDDVTVAIGRWSRVIKPGGAMFITVPCATFYEHGLWPSQFNTDHKQRFSFCPMPDTSPMGNCHSLGNMLRIGESSGLRLIEAWLELDGYDWALKGSRSLLADQTQLGACAQICYVFERIKKEEAPVKHGLFIGGLPVCPKCQQPLADGEKKCLTCG